MDEQKLLKEIFSTPNGYKFEHIMFEKMKKILRELRISYTTDASNNILVEKGSDDKMPAVCCHMDSVFNYDNFDVKYKNGEIHAFKKGKHVGIGGDDKCGIFIALLLLKSLPSLKVVFTSLEEIGGIGSSNIDLSFFDNVKILAAIDRRDNNDFINNVSGIEVFPEYKKYEKVINSYGFKANNGIFCDLKIFYDRGLRIPMFNISAGYRNPHTENEYVVIQDMYKTYNFLKFFLHYYIKDKENE